jgi:FtsP/CotA-like multicopper oxidase with cupredoxin domain
MKKNPGEPINKGEKTSGESNTTEHPRGIERRDFLKLGAGGMIASVAAACAVPPVTAPGAPSDSAALDAADSANEGEAPPETEVPEIDDDLVDPALLSSESWQEPWTWRPEDWPDRRLQLNVIRNQNPASPPSPANFSMVLFSYGGISPAPTIRVSGMGEWKLTVRNTLGLNHGLVALGPAVLRFDMPPYLDKMVCKLANEQLGVNFLPDDPERCRGPGTYLEQIYEATGAEVRPNWHIGGHVNGVHAMHTTNLHTHGLHVPPQTNPDGTHSDNIFLRIIPAADYRKRKQELGAEAKLLGLNEHVAELDYDIRLPFERNGRKHPHPPGTHWYHPHSHGSTHTQVASGMAGFLVVEGDVDEAINRAMTGQAKPDPEERTGPWDYRERLLLMQRVFVNSEDHDAGIKRRNLRFPPFPTINGLAKPTVIKMRPGAVERWRVINGSVDGSGTKRFMVLDGQYTVNSFRGQFSRVVVEETGEGEEKERTRRLEPVTERDMEDAKLDIQQLSVDGITLVVEEDGKPVHRIRDLSRRNAGTKNPFVAEPAPGESPAQTGLRGIEDCFRDGDSLRRAFVRPNEVLMTNANRSDLIFKAPLDSAGKVFTIFAKESQLHSDTHQHNYQMVSAGMTRSVRRPGLDVVLAYIHVEGEPVEGGDFDIQGLNEHLPPVPDLLMPIADRELEVPPSEAGKTGVPAGSLRTRTLAYSGTGGTDMPIIETPPGFSEQHPDLEHRLWGEVDGVKMLLPHSTGTMAIHPDFDLQANPDPGPPRKFSGEDPVHPRMLLDTAEEWVVYNNSMTMWSHTDLERFPQPGSYDGFHFTAYPLSRPEGQRRHAEDPEFQISSKGNDHPFHIHINPMWVLRIDVPDENGELHNVLPEPCWMDTVAIPRNGGRIVFRSRFEDYTGKWINHCHILSHEDNGMMQLLECVDDASKANYRPRKRAAAHGMNGRDVDAIYPGPSLELMYRQNLTFVDPSPLSPFEYPGFDLEIPKLEE